MGPDEGDGPAKNRPVTNGPSLRSGLRYLPAWRAGVRRLLGVSAGLGV